MRVRLRSWWQKVKQRPWITVAVVVGIVFIVVLILGYWLNWDWTGLGPYTPPAQASNFSRGKTLWDWLQLLIVPTILAIGGFWLNQLQKNRDDKATEQRTNVEREVAAERAEIERSAAEKRAQTEREIAEDNQREAALQDYIDKMSEILLEKMLRDSKPDDEVRNIARVRTLTVLPRLDGKRKGSVVQFLHESGLINIADCVVDLYGTNLREVFLPMINLNETLLSGADLGKANLIGASLIKADVGDTFINDANLFSANLSMANLSESLLGGSNLSQANLSEANLEKASLIDVDLSEANLNKADLSGAFLGGACLKGASLKDACLRGAKLRGAKVKDMEEVKDADLSGANLQGADLRRAIVTREQLEKAQSLEGAIMPDGSKHP